MMRAHVLLAAILAGGCGSSDPETSPPADTGVDPFATTGASGTFGSREDACARVAAALNARAGALGCGTLIGATCPKIVDDLEAKAGVAGKCMEYDLGSVANCEARIASYTSCADFNSGKACQLVLRQSATAVCAPATDAASEGG